MEFYETLEYFMQLKGVTAAELARRTGLRPAYFSDLKHGRAKEPTWGNIQAICDALGITPNDFARAQGIKLYGDK